MEKENQKTNYKKMEHNGKPYKTFLFMLAISFIVMYGIMFLNVDEVNHVYLSTTRAYMSILMVSTMAITMLLMMGKMYQNKILNRVIFISSTLVFVMVLTFLRLQIFVGDVQYMKAMIPHHSSAILTSENANIKDSEVRKLADGIIEAQKKEIAEMKAILVRMK